MHIRRQIALDTADGREASRVRAAVAQWTRDNRYAGAGATVVETVGYWDGGSATGLQVTFDWPAFGPDGCQGDELWRSLLEGIAEAAAAQSLGHVTECAVNFQEVKFDRYR